MDEEDGAERRQRKDFSDFLLSSFNALYKPSHISVSDSVRHPCILVITPPSHPFFLELAQSGLYFLEPQASNKCIFLEAFNDESGVILSFKSD